MQLDQIDLRFVKNSEVVLVQVRSTGAPTLVQSVGLTGDERDEVLRFALNVQDEHFGGWDARAKA